MCTAVRVQQQWRTHKPNQTACCLDTTWLAVLWILNHCDPIGSYVLAFLEARHAQNSTAPVTRMPQKLCHPVKGLMQCRAARARGYAEWGCCYWGRGLKVQRSKGMRSIWRRWATRYLKWRGCCGGPWKPSRDANIIKSFGIGSRFNNLFFRLQIWINHISICIVIHLCFGIDSTTFAINMVPSGPALVPVVVEGLLFFPCAESCLQIPVKLQKSSL